MLPNLSVSSCRLAVALTLACSSLHSRAAQLTVEILPQFNGAPLMFDVVTNRTTARQTISVTRLDFLVSNFSLLRENGTWLEMDSWQAYMSAGEKRTTFQVERIPTGRYKAVRFLIGLTPDINKSDATQYGPGHPLNPGVNGLHWGWQGGYVFLALEGRWQTTAAQPNDSKRIETREIRESGYSFHLAGEPQLMTVELPLPMELDETHMLRLGFYVAQCFAGGHQIRLDEGNNTTHSRTNDPVAAQLHANIEKAFLVESFSNVGRVGLSGSISPRELNEGNIHLRLMASNATPYGLSFSALFPHPSLPLDNPLTEEGVALGRALFNEPRLSINNRQSCASCHELATAAGANQGQAVSRGSEGAPGTRNAMPLFNLAWKSAYFWDGRAKSLREQVLQPIENPVEMHESLSNVVAKLVGGQSTNYPVLFARAFGSAEVTPDRIARALEQFLLTQIACDSKFDRILKGEAQFSEEEQRGFELFHTEYDPRREQFGADCFHCHGGALFQNVAFANNGLDSIFTDAGRQAVTDRAGDRGKFAVPSLRNVAVTGPYMHDGRFKTLEEVVEHYASGVKRSSTLDPNLAKHPDGGVPLSESDKKALVSFLRTLTDERFRGSFELKVAAH